MLHGRDPGRGSRKTLKSREKDNVFIFYSDHGGSGVSVLPAGAGGWLGATELYDVSILFRKVLSVF